MESNGIEVMLSTGQTMLVSDCDELLARSTLWHANYGGAGHYYARGIYRGKRVQFHRLLMSHVIGRDLTTREVVDHKNRNTLDNRRGNIRLCRQHQNCCNRRKLLVGHPLYKGLRVLSGGKFTSSIVVQGVYHHLGTFSNPELAARAYDRAAIELHGEFAHLNFPRSDYQ